MKFKKGEQLQIIANREDLVNIGATSLYNQLVSFDRFHGIKGRIYVMSSGYEWWIYEDMVSKVNAKPFEGDMEFDIYV